MIHLGNVFRSRTQFHGASWVGRRPGEVHCREDPCEKQACPVLVGTLGVAPANNDHRDNINYQSSIEWTPQLTFTPIVSEEMNTKLNR